MAQESNLLILDEPTNDLDIETLDLLQDVLGDYDGTVLLVSHDRDFLDRVATTTIALEPGGKATVYAGGWSDYQAQKPSAKLSKAAKQTTKPNATRPKKEAETAGAKTALSFTEKHRLEALPAEIARMEAEIVKLEDLLGQPNLFTEQPVKFNKATTLLLERQEALAQAEALWLELEEKAGG